MDREKINLTISMADDFSPVWSPDRTDIAIIAERDMGGNLGAEKEQQQILPENGVTLNHSYQIIKHVLMPGETLYDLEKVYGLNWRVIQKVNRVFDPNQLRAGMIILMPVNVELG